jgi:D-amino-acid oxidase
VKQSKGRVAVVGAGIAGLTCAVVLREGGYEPVICGAEPPGRTTSRVAAALWYQYHVKPEDLATEWALASHARFRDLTTVEEAGVSLVELHCVSRFSDIPIPKWAQAIGYRALERRELVPGFLSGYAVEAPFADTRKYLKWLETTATSGGEAPRYGHTLHDLNELGTADYVAILNCTGYGARSLVPDQTMVANRGQVVVVPEIQGAPVMVCVDDPLLYILPREGDCVLGGVNEMSDSTAIDPSATTLILDRCRAYLESMGLTPPLDILEERVGLRPYRDSGVCLRARRLQNGMLVVDNYGHGGCGITLSWGCAQKAVELLKQFSA